MTLIVSGKEQNVLQRIGADEQLGTRLYPAKAPLAARKQWLASQLQVRGYLTLDEGAVNVLRAAGRSLLAVGVTAVEGRFSRGDLVVCLAPGGVEIARGLVNYNADETRRIIGKASRQIEEILGYIDEPELIHRDNLVLTV
jgi:glutamate 5-kinase